MSRGAADFLALTTLLAASDGRECANLVGSYFQDMREPNDELLSGATFDSRALYLMPLSQKVLCIPLIQCVFCIYYALAHVK